MPEAADELPRVIAVPSDRLWLDPPFIARQLFTQAKTAALAMGAAANLLGSNTARWAVGFHNPQAAFTTASVAPWALTSEEDGVLIPAKSILWFPITTYGSIVTGEWAGFCASPITIRVIEVIRLQ